MIIAMPMKKAYPLFLERGSLFYGKAFDGAGAYSFKSYFVDKKMNPLPIWIVTMPFDVVKTQQRSFVRLDVALPILIEYSSENPKDEMVWIKAKTKDLSAGGLQIVTEEKIKLGKQLKVILELPEYGVFEIDGEVLRMTQPQADRKLYWTSIKFIGIQETVRDKISKFIFKKQVEQRQKRL